MKKCENCGTKAQSNFCPDCGGEMIETNSATEIIADEVSDDAENIAQPVDNEKNFKDANSQNEFFNKAAIKNVVVKLSRTKEMFEDKKRRWVLIGTITVLILIIIIGICKCGANGIEGKWIESESGEIVFELQDGKAYLYDDNISGQYEEDKRGIVITIDGKFYRLSKESMGRYTILVDIESGTQFYPSEKYESILEIKEKEAIKKLKTFKKELESTIIGDWRESDYSYEDLYRFTQDGKYQSTTISTDYDWTLSYVEGEYSIEYDEGNASVSLLIDGDSIFTVYADEAESAIRELEQGLWYNTDFYRETDTEDATKWLEEAKEDN